MMKKMFFFDDRRMLAIPGNRDETLAFCVEHFIKTANEAIYHHGYFAVALSGGRTPKGIFALLAKPENRSRVAWDKVWLFWSDERAVPPDSRESNYRMAMDAGFSGLGVL